MATVTTGCVVLDNTKKIRLSARRDLHLVVLVFDLIACRVLFCIRDSITPAWG